MQECITITQDASKKEMCYMAVENILMGKLPPQFDMYPQYWTPSIGGIAI